jgi:hypothetical protein|tara:strand:- start:30 stop:386 length:357 start_codon:yes stop_codon:yes gene_type:complete
MNPITDIIFTVVWLGLLFFAIRSMSRALGSQYIDPGDNERPRGMWTTRLKKAVHPEMRDVEPGTELMGVNFEEKPTSCDLEEYQALQARIEELRLELDPYEDEDDDDDDGDVPAIVRT